MEQNNPSIVFYNRYHDETYPSEMLNRPHPFIPDYTTHQLFDNLNKMNSFVPNFRRFGCDIKKIMPADVYAKLEEEDLL